MDYPRLSWSCRSPPVEEVLQNFFEFQAFHNDFGISEFQCVRCFLGASWTVKGCLLFDHSL